nr:hypothetical protein Cry52Nrm2_p069 [Cryptomonas curvata]
MNIIKEEIWECEFFIIRKFFIYPINKMKFEKFLNAVVGQKGMVIHNLFIFANIKECSKKNYFRIINNSNLKYKHNKPILKKQKTNYINFLMCLNSVNGKNTYLNEKVALNLKINNIRYELRWKFKKIGIFFPLKYYFKTSSLLFKLIQTLFKIKKWQRYSFIRKFSLVLKSIIKNLFYFF